MAHGSLGALCYAGCLNRGLFEKQRGDGVEDAAVVWAPQGLSG